MAACASRGYAYAGVQYTYECYCGNKQPATALKRADNECNRPCPGNSNEKCGGYWRMNVYSVNVDGLCYADNPGQCSKQLLALAIQVRLNLHPRILQFKTLT